MASGAKRIQYSIEIDEALLSGLSDAQVSSLFQAIVGPAMVDGYLLAKAKLKPSLIESFDGDWSISGSTSGDGNSTATGTISTAVGGATITISGTVNSDGGTSGSITVKGSF